MCKIVYRVNHGSAFQDTFPRDKVLKSNHGYETKCNFIEDNAYMNVDCKK